MDYITGVYAYTHAYAEIQRRKDVHQMYEHDEYDGLLGGIEYLLCFAVMPAWIRVEIEIEV